MEINEVREYFLSKLGTVEETPFNIAVPVFKVGGKMFSLINIHEEGRKSINLKYPKNDIAALREMSDFIRPGYHMSKDHWNTIYLDGDLEDSFVKELIDVSYDLVFKSLTKKVQNSISQQQ